MKKKYLGAGTPRLSILSAAISLILCSQAFAQQTTILPTVVVSGDKMSEFGISMTGDNLEARRFANSDTVTLLNGLPGISSYTGGV